MQIGNLIICPANQTLEHEICRTEQYCLQAISTMTPLVKLSKLNCSDGMFYLLLSCESEKDEIDLTLLHGVKSWSGKIKEEDFVSWSEKTKLKLYDYKSQTMKALSGENVGGKEFVYDFREDRNGFAELAWKRILQDGDIKFQLGCVKLQLDLNLASSMCRILDTSIELNLKLQNHIQSVTEERDKLASERAAALQKLDKLVSVKEDTEKELYSKFVVVLNEKKAKIRELKNQLERSESVSGNSSTAGASKAAPVRITTTVHSEDDSESSNHVTDSRGKADDSDMEYKTDDDDELKGSSSSSGKVWNQRKDVLKKKQDHKIDYEIEDDILMLDDGCNDDTLYSLPKRSRKARLATAKTSLSKPTVPLAESPAAQASTSRRNSLRKASSKSSSHNLDVNNLIDAMD